MSKYSKAYFNPYSDSFSCRVALYHQRCCRRLSKGWRSFRVAWNQQ